MATASHSKVNNIADWTQDELDAQVALGFYPAETLLADIVLPSDWNDPLTVTLGADENFVTDAEKAALPTHVVGPASVVDNVVCVFDGTTGKLIKTSGYIYVNNTDSRTGFGVSVPTARLHLMAGTTAANTGPLKFTDGPLTDVIEAGLVEYYNGHWYLSNGARHAIDSSTGVVTSNVAVTNTVTETDLYSHTLSANELHADERVILDVSGVVTNASAADDYTIKVYIGGTLIQTLARVGGNVANAGWEFKYSGTVRTAGASGTMVTHSTLTEGALIYSAGVATTTAIDTTIADILKITVTWANAKAGNVITMTQGHITFVH